MITFHLEPWEAYYADPDREGLWWEHYTALGPAHCGLLPMAPDLDSYRALDRAGQLVVLVARERGRMVGYSIFLTRRHLHYSALCAFEDAYFLSATSRRGSAGWRLLSATLAEIWRRGCVRAFFMTKEFASVATIFERLGGQKSDEVWAFWAPGRGPGVKREGNG